MYIVSIIGLHNCTDSFRYSPRARGMLVGVCIVFEILVAVCIVFETVVAVCVVYEMLVAACIVSEMLCLWLVVRD